MKAQTERSQPEFNPISLALQEGKSDQELNILYKIFRANNRIPDVLFNDQDINSINRTAALILMEEVHSKLVQYVKYVK